MPTQTRFAASELIEYAAKLLDKAGLEHGKSKSVAEVRVEADLLGHDTHGLNLLPSYLESIETGEMTTSGAPRVIADFPAAVTWDGMRLTGPWVTVKAIDLAIERVRRPGESGLRKRERQLKEGVSLYLTIMGALAPWSQKFGVKAPPALG